MVTREQIQPNAVVWGRAATSDVWPVNIIHADDLDVVYIEPPGYEYKYMDRERFCLLHSSTKLDALQAIIDIEQSAIRRAANEITRRSVILHRVYAQLDKLEDHTP